MKTKSLELRKHSTAEAGHNSAKIYNEMTNSQRRFEMADKKSTDIVPAPQSGMIHNVVVRTKLVLRLMADPRVSPLIKLIPIGSIIYLVSPIDIIMGIPGLAALDDAAILGLGYYFFIEMCPPGVVDEHLKAIEGSEEKKQTGASEDVVDGEATDIK
jgi:uncharacterized membrane protein YkvA (DUF1232 family)